MIDKELAIIDTLVGVIATEMKNGNYSYKAVAADGTEYPLMASSSRLYANVFFYTKGYVNGNAKGNALNGHCTYGKNVSSSYKEHFIRSLEVMCYRPITDEEIQAATAENLGQEYLDKQDAKKEVLVSNEITITLSDLQLVTLIRATNAFIRTGAPMWEIERAQATVRNLETALNLIGNGCGTPVMARYSSSVVVHNCDSCHDDVTVDCHDCEQHQQARTFVEPLAFMHCVQDFIGRDLTREEGDAVIEMASTHSMQSAAELVMTREDFLRVYG